MMNDLESLRHEAEQLKSAIRVSDNSSEIARMLWKYFIIWGELIHINIDSCYQLVQACFGKGIPFMGICH